MGASFLLSTWPPLIPAEAGGLVTAGGGQSLDSHLTTSESPQWGGRGASLLPDWNDSLPPCSAFSDVTEGKGPWVWDTHSLPEDVEA